MSAIHIMIQISHI